MQPTQHLQKATQNDSFAQWVQESRPESCDWSATAFFYAVLHQMDDYLHRHGYCCESHKERNDKLVELVKTNQLPDDQYKQYMFLYNLSRDARYNVLAINEAYLGSVVKTKFSPLVEWLKRN